MQVRGTSSANYIRTRAKFKSWMKYWFNLRYQHMISMEHHQKRLFDKGRNCGIWERSNSYILISESAIKNKYQPVWSSCLGNGCWGKLTISVETVELDEFVTEDVICAFGFLGYFFFGLGGLVFRCTLWTCSRILSLRPELWLQKSHLNGLSWLWTVAMWRFSLSFRPKEASHKLQPKGFSL